MDKFCLLVDLENLNFISNWQDQIDGCDYDLELRFSDAKEALSSLRKLDIPPLLRNK